MKVALSLDTNSINKAIRQVESYKKSLSTKIDKLCKRLAEIGAEAARETFGPSVEVKVEKANKGYQIVASGRGVCFIEFGAGARASIEGEVYEDIPFKVEPGSWSESELGAHTYSEWVKTHGSDADYPYNRTPKPGMLNAYNAIVDAIQAAAKEVFK